MSQLTNFFSSTTAPSLMVQEKIQIGDESCIRKARQDNLLRLRVNRGISNSWHVIRNAEMRVNFCTLITLVRESQRTAS